MKYCTGLVIGRFQPFHLGHKYLIKKALRLCDEIVIGIGSSNRNDCNNIFSYTQRRNFIKKFIKQERLQSRIRKIIPIPDIPSDDEWLKLLLQKITPDLVIGNNDWVNSIFKKAGLCVERVPHYKRYLFEGVKIRKLITEGKAWQDRVPKYLVDEISRSITYTRIV